jgi:hypothetical protein
MNETERLDYIFGHHTNEPIVNRFGWLESLLGDIKTFENTLRECSQLVEGGGNLSIPILVCTGLELVSALYVGKTSYILNSNYNTLENVEKFINHFFPSGARKIPRLIWDGVRNGVDHLFIPKSMRCSPMLVQFTFYVQNATMPSTVAKVDNMIIIRLNSIEFFHTLRQAIQKYRIELERDENLQKNFIDAWKSIEGYVRNITDDHQKSGEVQYLLNELNQSNPVNLFNDLY